MSPTGAAKVAGAVGWPAAHSRSPRLHGCWLDRTGIDEADMPLRTGPPARAQASGRAALGGLGMLIHQARPAFKAWFGAWFGVDPEVTPGPRAVLAETVA